MKLVWSRLKNVCCPKCNLPLHKEMLDDAYICKNTKCDFEKISEKRFNEIIEDLYKPVTKRAPSYNTDDNMEALNSLGRKVLSRDFSDV